MRHIGRAHIFRRENGDIYAVDAEALDRIPIDDELGEPLFGGEAVAGAIAFAFLARHGGTLFDGEIETPYVGRPRHGAESTLN